jgi:plastocyanin
MPVAVAAAGTRVFIATAAGQLQVVDLSDRSSPKLLAIQDMASPVTAMAAFLDGVAVGLQSSYPEGARDELLSGPSILGAEGLTALGRTLFIAMGDEGLFTGRDESDAAVTANVSVGNFFFSPSNVNINQGDKVHWTWISGTHTTTSGTCPGGNCTPDGTWNSGTKTGGSFDFVFNSAGNFPYFCEVHGVSMTGRVAVASIGPTPLSATASASPSSGSAPLAVAFTGTASGGTPPYAYAWSFGDGTADPSEKDPPHTYTQVGTYSAVLTVTDAASGTAQAAPVGITVTEPSSNPPVISVIKKVAPPFAIVISGSNLQNGIRVFINGVEWATVTWKNLNKIKLGGGTALKAAVPKGASTPIRLLNPDGGSATQTFTW